MAYMTDPHSTPGSTGAAYPLDTLTWWCSSRERFMHAEYHQLTNKAFYELAKESSWSTIARLFFL